MKKQFITTEISKQEYIDKLQSIRNMSVYDIFRPDPAWLTFYIGKPYKNLRSTKKLFLCPNILITTTYKWRLYQDDIFLFSGDNLPNEKYDDLWDRTKGLLQTVSLKLLCEIKITQNAEEAELLFNDGYKLVVEQENKKGEPSKLLRANFRLFEVYKDNEHFYCCRHIKKR